MSSANIAAKRSPEAAATSPGYQGSDGASSNQQTTEQHAVSGAESQAAPASEPAKSKEVVEPSTDAAADGAGEVAGGAKASEEGGGDATPKEVCVCVTV